MSVRTRLVLASLATLVVGLGALVVAGNLLLAARVCGEARTLLDSRAQAELSELEITDGRIRVRAGVEDRVLDREAWVFDAGGLVERPARAKPGLTAAAARLAATRRTTEREVADDLRMRAVPVREADRVVGAVVVAVSVAPLERLQKEVLLGSLIISGLALLAGGLATRGAVAGALRPVAQMTDAADTWRAEDLERRFDLGPPRDELTALAHTLDGLLDRIAATRRHEQRFAAEVAHELRTPLARLRGSAELSLRDPETLPPDDALAGVIAQSDELERAIAALLAVARRELSPGDGTVDLRALACELEGIEVTGPEHLPPAEGEPEVVRRVLAPLVDNARRHARSAVRIELSAGHGRVRAAVRDDGPGIDPALGQRVFEPGVSGGPDSGGAGLGLPLARRLADSCGGEVRVGPGPGGCFVLELPAR